MKRIQIGKKPTASPEQWIANRTPTTATKRLTIDVPVALHTRIKSQCAMRGVQMADELRSILEQSFPSQPSSDDEQANRNAGKA